MNQKSSKQPLSKRQALRQQRVQAAKRQRIIVIGSIVLIAGVFLALLLVPQIQKANEPVGDFVQITPDAYTGEQGTSIGDPNAPVKIQIFEDFKCSACQAFTQNIEPAVIDTFVKSGQAYYTFHNYPFMDDDSVVKDSDNAANAALCAGEQNRFYDFKKLLYANLNYVVGEFSEKRMIAFAESLDLDMKTFESCFEERKFSEQIKLDMDLVEQLRISGTPSVFVNGVQVAPGFVPTFEQISEAVNNALATANQ